MHYPFSTHDVAVEFMFTLYVYMQPQNMCLPYKYIRMHYLYSTYAAATCRGRGICIHLISIFAAMELHLPYKYIWIHYLYSTHAAAPRPWNTHVSDKYTCSCAIHIDLLSIYRYMTCIPHMPRPWNIHLSYKYECGRAIYIYLISIYGYMTYIPHMLRQSNIYLFYEYRCGREIHIYLISMYEYIHYISRPRRVEKGRNPQRSKPHWICDMQRQWSCLLRISIKAFYTTIL